VSTHLPSAKRSLLRRPFDSECNLFYSPRYVEDLRQLVNTFIDSLLPPRPQVSSPTIQLSSWTSPLGSGPTLPNPSSPPWTPTDLISSSHHNNSPYSPPSSSRPHPPVRALSAEPPRSHTANNTPAIENLPIAARFLSIGPAGSPPVLSQGPEFSNSTVPGGGTAGTIPYGQIEQNQHPSLQQPKANTNTSNQLPIRSHASLPPPPRNYPHPSLDLRSTSNGSSRKSAKPSSSSGAGGREEAIVDLGLPDDLRAVLEVLRDGVYEGHLALSRALKKRYDEQYPLVRSLADVFTQHVSRYRIFYFVSETLCTDWLFCVYFFPPVLRLARVQYVRLSPATRRCFDSY
jgi:hypothetical protein